MRISAFLFCTVLCFSFGCNSAADYRRSGISDEEMANIMFDMHFADALLAEFSGEQRDSISALVWERMTNLYGMTEEEIRKEVARLENEPERMKLIMGRVKEMADSIP